MHDGKETWLLCKLLLQAISATINIGHYANLQLKFKIDTHFFAMAKFIGKNWATTKLTFAVTMTESHCLYFLVKGHKNTKELQE